jgi:hypothetical protein
MNPWQVDENNEVTRCLDMLQVMGEVGQPVLDVQRRGTCMYMQVPNLSGGTMRTLLRALLRAAQVDKGITQWELRQEAERPALCIDQSAIQVALNLADGLWGTIDPLFFVELPLIAHAMSNAGEVADVSATTVLCLAAAHVAGERDRLAGSLAVGAEPAKAELLEAAGHICSGLRAAAVFIAEENACRRVERFVQVLAGECQWFAAAPPPALIRAFLPAERVLRRHAPAHVPWIGSQSVQKR